MAKSEAKGLQNRLGREDTRTTRKISKIKVCDIYRMYMYVPLSPVIVYLLRPPPRPESRKNFYL